MGLTAVVLSGYAMATVAPTLYRSANRVTKWLVVALPAAVFFYLATLIGPVMDGRPVEVIHDWVPSLGLSLAFHLDGLGLLFAMLISGIGALVVFYAGGYLAGHPLLGRFYTYILAFMGSMLGVVLSDSLLTLFVFWELTSITSYLLIGFDHEREAARKASLQALLVTGAGGLALLAGFVLVGQAGGTMSISALRAQPGLVQAHPLYAGALALVLLGAFTKSAQFPFHFWLPNAMEAPTPVSAYLHAATMVKAGIYLLARLTPVLGGTVAWQAALVTVGGITMVIGAVLTLRQVDLKRILAYATVSSLGVMVMLIGVGTEHAILAALVYLLAHALYKGTLFLVAGAVDHEAGTRDVRRLSGLRLAMPFTAVAAAFAALSMAGLPPLSGFIGKELFYEATWEAPTAALLLTAAAVVANVLLVAVAFRVGVKPFVGPPVETPKHAHQGPINLWLGPVVLASLGLLAGLFPMVTANAFIGPALSAVLGHPETVKLGLWHGFNIVVGLSALTLVLGAAVYVTADRLQQATAALEVGARIGPGRWYTWLLDAMNAVAAWQTRVLQNGYLRYYLLTILTTTVVVVGYTLFTRGWLPGDLDFRGVGVYEFTLSAMMLLGALAAVRTKSRLVAIACMGVVGYGLALIYVLFGAPDLAMTQFLVETLAVILFVLVFYRLPAIPRGLSSRGARLRDAAVALSVGALMTSLDLVASGVDLYPRIAEYFNENSYTLAHGRNIVNVILVDFRGFDTLGEITVLSVAGIGVFALLRLRLSKGSSE